VAALWVGFGIALFVAIAAFSLLLVLARRLRNLEERIGAFFIVPEGGLPAPGTPVPEFVGTSCDGLKIDTIGVSGPNQILAFLTTECAVCREQVYVLRGAAAIREPKPLVVVAGPPDDRAEMVGALRGFTNVMEEPMNGPLATVFGVQEFPAILLYSDGVLHIASHGMAAVLESAQLGSSTVQ